MAVDNERIAGDTYEKHRLHKPSANKPFLSLADDAGGILLGFS
jgi:hypothetical protein